MWFYMFIIRIRNSNENESALVNYAVYLVQEMRNSNLSISEQVFRYLLEACGYFQMDQKAMFLAHSIVTRTC